MKIFLIALCACAPFVFAHGAAPVPPPHPMFQGDAVHEIRLTFSQPDWWNLLTANYGDGTKEDVPYISASFAWNGIEFRSVGVRFKGFGSYFCTTGPKKPFRIKFNEFVKGQKIGGLNAINLNNGCGDPSYAREIPYYEAGAAMGLLAPRSNYAALYINERYWGLYVVSEVVNGDWLRTYYASTSENGNLYKGDPLGTFEDLGDDQAPYKSAYEKKTNESQADWSDLLSLIHVVNRTPLADLPARLEPMLDVDSVLRALALDIVTVNLDSYRGYGHNYFLYHRQADRKFVFIAWDGSLAFGGFSFEYDSQGLASLPLDWTAEHYNPSWKRPLASRLLAVPRYQERYRRFVRELADGPASASRLGQRLRDLRAMARPWVEKERGVIYSLDAFDAAMTLDQWVFADPSWQPGSQTVFAPALIPLIERRERWIREERLREESSRVP